MILTAATWNLRGIDDGSGARLRRQLTLLAGLNLDVAGFQECKHWADDDSALLHLAEEQLGMTGFRAGSAHHGCHLAVFVRESAGLQVIEPRHERGHPYWHAVALVVVRAEGLPELLYLASIHFAPSSPVIRLAEAEAFELIAMGDINAMPCMTPIRRPRPGTGGMCSANSTAAPPRRWKTTGCWMSAHCAQTRHRPSVTSPA